MESLAKMFIALLVAILLLFYLPLFMISIWQFIPGLLIGGAAAFAGYFFYKEHNNSEKK